MVFESLIVDLINKYLGNYIEALNASQLKIGLLGGNAQLENVDIKANAFDGLNLPVRVLQGHIGSLTLKIPFKYLYTEPTVVELDGLYVLVVPKTAVEYDESKEAVYKREAKLRELEAIEEARALKGKSANTDAKTDSFTEKLAAQIIKNLQVDIRNIHVRYEDSFSIAGQTFSVGFTLSGLTFKTSNFDSNPSASRAESLREFTKFVKLTSLGVYWNHNSAIFSNKARAPLRSAMRKSIASPENPKTGFSYVIQPISSTASLHIHMRPEETGFSSPRVILQIDFPEIELNFSLYQYHDLTSSLDAADRMITQSKYRKYRPQVLLHGNAKTWWNYAFTAILEETVRRRHRMWSWIHIKRHRHAVREYIVLWKRRLRGEKLNQEQLKTMEAYENLLDVFNLVLSRQQAELQHYQTKTRSDSAKPKTGGGFFRWFSRSSSAASSTSISDQSDESESSDIVRRLQSEMTAEEKGRLYAAINYSETATASKFPITYVSTVISVTLRQLSFILVDENLSDSRILKLAVNKLTAGVELREGDQASSFAIRLDSLEALGARPSLKQTTLTRSSEIPVLITSSVAMSLPNETTSQSRQLLTIDFETNPLDRKADQRVRICADPLQIVYDAESINKIVHFLAPPAHIRLQELSNQVLTSLEDVKEVTVSGLRHLASQRAYTDVIVDVRPSYIILPDNGVFRSNCRVLLVDLGSLSVRSTPRNTRHASLATVQQSGVEQDSQDVSATRKVAPRKSTRATFEELKEDAYDIYEIALSSVQVLMVEQNEDWRSLRSQTKSPNHILRPLGMNFKLKRCLLHNDVNLPKILLDGCLPVFSVDVTDRVMKSLFELVSNVPFPEPDKRFTTPENPDDVLKGIVVLPGDGAVSTRDVLRAARRLDRSTSDSTLSSWFSDLEEEDDEEEGEEASDSVSSRSDLETGQRALYLTDDSHTLESSVHESDLRIRTNKATRRIQREAALRSRRHSNLIDLKVDFVVRMIQLRIMRREIPPKADTVILSFSIHEVGTHMVKRRWDQELQAYVGTLSISVPTYSERNTGEPLCMAKTKRHVEGHHLLAIHLLAAEKDAPDFERRYNNTRHHLKCQFKALEVCIHQEATLLLIDFMNDLLRSLVLPTTQDSTQTSDMHDTVEVRWAARIGDQSGLEAAVARAEMEADSLQQLPDRVTALSALEGHLARRMERRVIRLDAAASAARSGKRLVIREVNIIQWLINATLDMVTVTLCSETDVILSTTIHGLRLDVQSTYVTTELSAVLSELSVTDRIESTHYRKIVWVDPVDSVVSLQLTHFAQGTQLPENVCDPDKVDMVLSLQLGKLHFIFLNYFVMRFWNFMKGFQMKTETVLQKVHELSDAAVQQVQDAVQKSTEFRLGLTIVAQAPAIYMPQHSFSSKALLIDLGCITYANRFEFVSTTSTDVAIPISKQGVMLEHVNIQLDNLRLSRAILSDSTIKAEKRVLHPINISLRMKRNLNPVTYSGIPLLVIDGCLKSIHVSLCQGDYRVIQEVILDNFAEVPTLTHLADGSHDNSQSLPPGQTPMVAFSSNKPTEPGISKTTKSAPTNAPNSFAVAPTTALQFTFVMDSVTMDLFIGDVSMSDWHHKPLPELQLALCTLDRFTVFGHLNTDASSEVEVKLCNMQLVDTRPDSDRQINNVLHHSGTADPQDDFICVTFKQDASRRQKVDVKLRSVHLCASMNYLLALADFHMKSYPVFERKLVPLAPVTESGKRKRQDDPPHQKPKRRPNASSPSEYSNELDVLVEVGSPELVLLENLHSLDASSLKVNATMRLQYSMRKEVVIVDAVVRGLAVVACPYNEPVTGRFVKEVLSPTDLSFYCKIPINGSMQGSLHLDTMLININPGTIQLISRIVSSLQTASNISDSREAAPSNSVARSKPFADEVGLNFWDPVSLDQLDLPYLKSSNYELPSNSSKENGSGSITTACDVSKVLEQMEERRTERIAVRLQTIRVVLESQIGTRSMPMLVLESSLDGEVISPNTALQLKLTVDISLSYFNDILNHWEPLLETLSDDDYRMWSMQIEMSTTNVDELLAEEDLDEVGCLQASTNSILLLSRDNMELTLSKTALDLLSNLGRSFEAAYKERFSESEFRLGGQSAAPYRIQNRTGLPIALCVDTQSIQVMNQDSRSSVSYLRKSYTSTANKRQHKSVRLGLMDVPRSSDVRTEQLCQIELEEVGQGTYLLNPDQEIGLIEAKRSTRKNVSICAMNVNTSRLNIWLSWFSPSGSKSVEKSQVPLRLYSSENILIHLPKSVSVSSAVSSPEKGVPLPVVAQISTHLGMRVISLRSTLQIVNETSEPLCLYPRAVAAPRDTRTTRFAVLDVGEIYALPVEIVNSREFTGIFIGPDVGVTTTSDVPVYWPQSACIGANSGFNNTDLVYLAPMTEQVGSSANFRTLQSISSAMNTTTITDRPLFAWPVQLIQCKSKASSLVYHYVVATLYAQDPAAHGIGSKTVVTSSAVGSHTMPSTTTNEYTASDFQMIVRNAVVLHNVLPISINYILSDSIGEIVGGARCTMTTVSPSNSVIDVWFDYDSRVYRGKLIITPNMEELTVATFESQEGYELLTLHLGLRSATDLGQVVLTLYSPYWMINKTGRNLTYKSTDDAEVTHSAKFRGALLHSFLAKSMFGKHKACLRVDDSVWSDKFSLDTVGSSGRVVCKTKQKLSFEIGVKINLSSSGLTKIVTFMPYFLLVNNSSVDLECSELDETVERTRLSHSGAPFSGWIRVPAGEAVPFWPQATSSKKMLFRCRINEQLVTDLIPFYESHSILMKLPGKYAGIFVEVQTNEEATVITLQLYQEGMALVRIVNHLGDYQPIYFHQRGVERVHQLDAGMSVMYAWDSPQSERELLLFCDKNDKPQSCGLVADCIEEFYVNDTKAYWVSFLWNMQRVLLLTQDVNAAKNARLSADLEPINLEIILSFQSIGLSLVDNCSRSEVAYVSVTSSGVRWSQVKRGNRLKPLKTTESDSLERAYTQYINQLRAGEPYRGITRLTDVGRILEVDFSQMMMLLPDRCELRRAFEPGVFLHYKNSASQMQLHTKVFRVQLDNQKMDCTFPVVLAPYPQPKSMALDTGPKPLIELSAIISRTAVSGSFRFKYFRVLIQEMVLKVDQGILNDLFDFFSASVSRVPELEAFQRDYQLIENRLIDSPVIMVHLQVGNRSIFDNFHISPIKMHVSFSLTGSTEGKTNAFPSEVLNLFLQSLGMVLTDVQDVIFKLAYFEHQACTMTVNQMLSEVTRHYMRQGLRQTYALVLGLDVLGNPFGVLRGMAQGVEDLFYEPVKGAVLGPEEFAEGVALGVKSLFGHAVGGAAGAVSRITGSIGKGVAALTLDEDYKRRRRERLANKPETFGAGLAQGGRGLVMGLFHGVAGVIMQPVAGAKKEGVEGFFKGVGKGLIGVVTRPVSGVVDFASSSFEGIRRIADNAEDIDRIRPPRYIRMDGVIRPYERQEAEGHLVLRQLDKQNAYGHYLFHIPSSRGSKFLLLTTSYLLIVESVDLLGTWTIHWQTRLDGLAAVPVVDRTGISITLKEKQKKRLTSGHQTKHFECDATLATAMVREIDSALSKKDSWCNLPD